MIAALIALTIVATPIDVPIPPMPIEPVSPIVIKA